MFNLNNYFIKQQEVEADLAATGGDTTATNSDVQDATEVQDNTEATEDDGNIEEATEAEADDGEQSDQVPEKYEFTLKDGLELDEALAEKFSTIAKDLRLSNEQANKIADLYADKIGEMQEAQTQAWAKQVSDWGEQLKSDSEFGGAKFAENAEIAKSAINKFGDDELKQALNDTGLGNHPALVKFMHKVGLAISEDSFETHEHSSTGNPTPQGLYRNSKMNP